MRGIMLILFFGAALFLTACNVDQLSANLDKASAEMAQLKATIAENPGVSPGIVETVEGIESTLAGVSTSVDELKTAEGAANLAGDITEAIMYLLLGGGGVSTLLFRKLGHEKIASYNAGTDAGIAIGNGTAANPAPI